MSLDAWFQCWTRSEKSPEDKVWLTEQLKFTREQLDKKSIQCEQLDAENKSLQARLVQEEQSGLQRQLEEQRAIHNEELQALQETHGLELERLREELGRERELHREASRLLHGLQGQRDEKVRDLQEELRNLSDGLAQKEEDMLNIQFSMAELQNRCLDQGVLVEENADAFQKASEELAEKEEALENAIQKQQELIAQMNLVSGELQGQVTQLTKELELSKASKEQVQAAVSRLEAEKSVLVAEVQQVRSKAATDQEALGEKMRQQEAEAQKKFEEFKQDLMQLNNCKDFELGQEAFKSCQHSGDLERQGPHGPHFPGPGDTDLVSPMVPSVLIAAEIDLGGTGHDTHGGAATLTIAPWQTSSDYKLVVQDFIRNYHLKPIFEEAVVRFLQELERSATTLPLFVKASLAEIYREYG